MAMATFDIWHIAIPVSDMAHSIQFYKSLGFVLIGTDEGSSKRQAFLATKVGGFSIELFEPLKPSAEFKTPDHLAFECQNIENFRNSLLSHTSLDVPKIEEFDNGVKCLNLKDPDGVTLQFFEGRAIYENSIAIK